jgi:hypothetical protein
MAPTPHQGYGLQVLGIVLIRVLILGDEPTKFRIILENEAAKFGRHVGKPAFIVAITRIHQISQVTTAKKPPKVDANEYDAGPASLAVRRATSIFSAVDLVRPPRRCVISIIFVVSVPIVFVGTVF